MRQLLFYNLLGEIYQQVISLEALPEKYGSGDCLIVDVDDPVDSNTTWVFEGALVSRPPRPAVWSAFDPVLREWYDPRSLDAVQDEAWSLVALFREAVNHQRSAVIAAGTDVYVTGYGTVALQGRPEDQASLQGLAFGAQLRLGMGDATTQMVFLDRENVLHYLLPTQMLELWQKGAGFVSAVYARSWVIKGMDPMTTELVDPALWQVDLQV